MKVLARILCVGMFASLFAGCASDGPYIPKLPPRAQSLYMDYQSRPENKVFIVAIDPSGDFAAGYDFGKTTKKEAYQAALDECNANRKNFGVLAKPYVYAINGKVVYEDAITQDQAAQ